ncbi:MAG: HAMP domain-containing histidine kinase [Bacteroidales bacterium]|nr:HAMP domain-containing histidine kinase [Bacteroidales bacterium]
MKKLAIVNTDIQAVSNMQGVSNKSENPTKFYSNIQMQKLIERNAYLEELIEQRTVKLTEVVATNTKFISIIAHDLRSPFNSIIGILEILKDSLGEYDINEIEKYINMVSESANRTLNLLDNLLVWTISQNKEKNFNPIKINLHELLDDELINNETYAVQKRISITHSIKQDIFINADMQMIRTILRNLIGNAIKFTSPGGEISITAKENQHFVQISVKDTGIGISPAEQAQLFKGTSIHSTTGTNSEQGMGLGLMLCKEFVELHGGSIKVESKPGIGSTFKFTMPNYL